MKWHMIGSVCLAALAGCATAPPDAGGNFARLNPRAATESSAIGAQVRWGGRIIGPHETTDGSCLVVETFTTSPDANGPYTSSMLADPAPFVACGGRSTADVSFDGLLATFTGAIAAPVTFDVPKAECVRTVRYRAADAQTTRDGLYAKSMHTLNGDVCTVSLARLEIRDATRWPQRQRAAALSCNASAPCAPQDTAGNSMGGFDSPAFRGSAQTH